MSERRIRKGDRVRLKPGVFLMQTEGETAKVQFIYRYRAPHLNEKLNSQSVFHVSNLERVKRV